MSLDDNAQTAMVYTESLPFSTEPSKVMAETLCEYCAAIDFEQLRLPSSKDVQELNEGKPIEPQLPFIQYQVRPHWSLGSQSRIESSAATCPFCREVCRVLEAAEVRAKVPDVFENDPICDVYFTLAGFIEAPPGVTWCRYQSSEKLLRQVAKSFHKQVYHLLSLRAQMLHFSDPSVIPHPRISLRWTVPEKHEMRWFQRYPISQGVIELFECFQSMDPVSKESKGLFTGVERPALIDMELPRRWLRSCLENDGGPCVPKPSGRKIIVPIFRLIDTKSNALVEFKDQNLDKIQYVTLSYVWGTTQQVMLKRENLLQLQLPGSLHGTTPRTITDAMIFTSNMGYRYIWVDVFCIIQDDDKDKATQLQRMGDIYKNSVFTIVAAAGGHSDAGLYGVRTPRKAMQRKVQVKSASPTQAPLWLMSTVMPLTGYFDPYTHGLPWHTRGWTLQERALSRRVFTFTGEQLLWSCRRCQRWEETETETSLASITFRNMEDANVTLDGPLRFDQSRQSEDVQAKFWKLVYDFSNRNLCFEGDAHDAFSAILREYTDLTGEQFVWGMPVSEGHFGSALCWEPNGTIFPRRKELTTLPTTSLNTKVPFPSWSWLGWKGKIRPFVAQPGPLKLKVSPYILRNTPLRLVKISDVPLDNSSRTTASPIDDTVPLHQKPAPDLVTLDIIYRTLSPDITPERLSRTPDDQLLFFWCERAYLYLEKPSQRHDNTYITVQDEEGATIEWIYQISALDDLDGEWEAFEESPHSYDSDPTQPKERMKAEFIAIASYPSDEPRFNVLWRWKTPISLVLFLIKRREGIAYRVAIVEHVPLRKWLRCEREKVLIALG